MQNKMNTVLVGARRGIWAYSGPPSHTETLQPQPSSVRAVYPSRGTCNADIILAKLSGLQPWKQPRSPGHLDRRQSIALTLDW